MCHLFSRSINGNQTRSLCPREPTFRSDPVHLERTLVVSVFTQSLLWGLDRETRPRTPDEGLGSTHRGNQRIVTTLFSGVRTTEFCVCKV